MAIAFFAMVLAICGLGGSNAGKEAVNNNVLAANYFSFYQAKNARQSALELAADEIEFGWLNIPEMPDAAKQVMRTKLAGYKATIARYESEPSTNEGKKELMARARDHEKLRDRALKQDPYFDYAEALLQIAIVLISVSIIASVAWLAFLGGTVGLIGRAADHQRLLPAGGDTRIGVRLLLHLAAGLDPVLEAAEVVDLLVAHVLEQLAGERGAPAGGAMQDHRLVECQALFGGRRRQVGLELQRAARNVDGACRLAGRGELGAVAQVDDDRALGGHLLRLSPVIFGTTALAASTSCLAVVGMGSSS